MSAMKTTRPYRLVKDEQDGEGMKLVWLDRATDDVCVEFSFKYGICPGVIGIAFNGQLTYHNDQTGRSLQLCWVDSCTPTPTTARLVKRYPKGHYDFEGEGSDIPHEDRKKIGCVLHDVHKPDSTLQWCMEDLDLVKVLHTMTSIEVIMLHAGVNKDKDVPEPHAEGGPVPQEDLTRPSMTTWELLFPRCVLVIFGIMMFLVCVRLAFYGVSEFDSSSVSHAQVATLDAPSRFAAMAEAHNASLCFEGCAVDLAARSKVFFADLMNRTRVLKLLMDYSLCEISDQWKLCSLQCFETYMVE